MASEGLKLQNHLPEELLEAKNLFEMSIDQTDHGKRLLYFEDALDAIDDYLSDSPDTPHFAFIENIRLTYAKRLIYGLSTIREKDIDANIFVQYVVTIEQKMKKEFQIIHEKFPELVEEYKSYLDYFRGFIP